MPVAFELPKLVKQLQNAGPPALRLYGLAKSQQEKGQLYDIIVDKWPNFNSIAISASNTKTPNYIKSEVTVYGKNKNLLKTFLQENSYFNWEGYMCYTGLASDLIQPLIEIAAKHGNKVETSDIYHTMVLDAKNIKEMNVPEGFILDTLKSEDAEEVNNAWRLGRGPETLPFMKYLIKEYHTSCIREAEGGALIGYQMMFDYGSIGLSQVRYQHRKLGLGQVLVHDLSRKIMDQRGVVYVYVPQDDTSMYKFYSDAGFEVIKDCMMVWAQYIPSDKGAKYWV